MGHALIASLFLLLSCFPAWADLLNSTPPAYPVKLIFIHHSTGENLLRNDYGRLGIALKTNNYFVSDTNYGWGPDSIGDRTDIPDWIEWFRSTSTTTVVDALLAEYGKHASYSRLAADPGGQNSIILFKSCFPNSNLEGNPNDPPSSEGWLTVGHAKWVYNQLLTFSRAHPDKLFVVITAPPVQDPTYALNARAFNNWLVNHWLVDNQYPFKNVAVFDFYNVLTDPQAHHRYNPATATIEHKVVSGHNTSAFASSPDDDHPNVAGSQKATSELVPLLNIFYNSWKTASRVRTTTAYSSPVLDGWILESSENSSIGGAVNNSADTLRVGDDMANRQYRSILSFSLNLPTNAVMATAKLKIKTHSLVGTDPFATHGKLLVDIHKFRFGSSPALLNEDFLAAANQAAAASLAGSPVNGWLTAGIASSGLPYINSKGITQFRLRFSKGDNDDFNEDFYGIYSGHTASTNQPKLIIQYYVP